MKQSPLPRATEGLGKQILFTWKRRTTVSGSFLSALSVGFVRACLCLCSGELQMLESLGAQNPELRCAKCIELQFNRRIDWPATQPLSVQVSGHEWDLEEAVT